MKVAEYAALSAVWEGDAFLLFLFLWIVQYYDLLLYKNANNYGMYSY